MDYKKPLPVITPRERSFWEHTRKHELRLQCCSDCGHYRYPASPVCADCDSDSFTWTRVSGRGKIISWVVFHRHYLPAYPPPYNAIAVRLAEGPTMISNLEGAMPEDGCIGRAMRLIYVTMPDGVMLPRWRYED